ncbi:GNAT family N-acetyltransferase [Eoetvoesiella caeni]
MKNFSVRLGDWGDVGVQAGAIRFEVFVREQKVPVQEELDEEDAHSVHALACDARGNAIATGRLLRDGHIGRMAVLESWRGRGVGSAVLLALVNEARRRGHARVELSAQCHACDFYAAHGFVAEGGVYLDAGIEHRTMKRPL